MIRPAAVSAIVAAAVLCAIVSAASGQVTEAPGAPSAPMGEPAFRPPPGQIFGPPDRERILGPFGPVFSPPAPRSPLNLPPTLSIREEYNDNVFLSNRNRRSDLITSFTPGLTLSLQTAAYRLSAGYDFSAEVYADNSQLSNVGDRQNLFLDASYSFSPGLTLSLTDRFTRTYNTPQTSVAGIATGRTEVTSNTFAPGLSYTLTPGDTLRLVGSYAITRIQQAQQQPLSSNSDVYGVDSNLDHTFTPRLTGTVGYQVQRFEFETGDSSTVHTPRLGGRYQITPTLTASVSGGASIQTSGAGTEITPSATVSLTQQFSFGAATLTYNRSVSPVATLAQTTDNQSIGGTLLVTTLVRGLSLTFAPGYNTSESSTVNVKTFTADLAASYQLTRTISVFGSYTLLRQQSSGASTLTGDVDQNRVFVGLQTRFPIDLY